MKVVDANVLLYAVDLNTEHHEASSQWLDQALGGRDTVGFTWMALTAFVRISTRIGLFPEPLTTADAMEQVRDWLAAPGARVADPTRQHVAVLGRLLSHTGSGGNLVSDAHLAAIALEHGADVVSYDADFHRFPELRSHRPDELVL